MLCRHLRRLPLACWQQTRFHCTRSTPPPPASPSSGLGPRRFYKKVGIEKLSDGHFAVTVDDKPVRTPLHGTLAAPSRALATAIAAEWDAQGERLQPASMPLTSLVSTARDIVKRDRGRVVGGVMKYLDSDAICIRPAYPRELVDMQDMVYGGVVRHVEGRFGERLNIVRGGLVAKQGEGVARRVRGVLEGLDEYRLAGVEVVTGCAKSVLVAVALLEGGVEGTAAVRAARCEEEWQAGVWGKVEGGHDLDEADVGVRIRAADMVFRFVDMDKEAFGVGGEGV